MDGHREPDDGLLALNVSNFHKEQNATQIAGFFQDRAAHSFFFSILCHFPDKSFSDGY